MLHPSYADLMKVQILYMVLEMIEQVILSLKDSLQRLSIN